MPELIILLMFSSLMCLMLTGQRVFGIMGFVGIAFALIFIDRGSLGYGFNAAIKLFNWYPMLTLPNPGSQTTCTTCSTCGSAACAADSPSARFS